MPKLLFFSRVALICNVCFLITFSMHYIPDIRNGVIPSTVIILGSVLAILLNIGVNILYMLLLLAGRLKRTDVPFWLIITNFVFFIVQIILLIK